MRNNKNYIQFLLLLLSSFMGFNNLIAKEVNIINCNPKVATSFAIFVDTKSFNECKDQIIAYKNVLEQEGLGTYIISAEWSNPQMVKNEISKLAARKPKMEGMVFIGDIPIVRVRQGQHFTTAFKMNEDTFPINESSVPSDRFYDCPNFKFDFIKRDSVNTNWFYYNLSNEGIQQLIPAYYSARIVVPELLVETTGIDKYTLLKKYLVKVVAAHKENNVLDKFIYFAGHGYNSDCLTAWRQQSIAFKSYFPEAFKEADKNKFLNFRQDPNMKFTLFTEMQRPDVDVFMFYEHGAPDKQYINGDLPSASLDNNISMLKMDIRNTYRRTKKEKKETFVKDVCAHFGLSTQIFSADSISYYKVIDSTFKADKDINLTDLSKLKTGAKFTMFNACYNGSFHQQGYVAGYHIFNDGKTIVTQGNTVNVLQDKWAEQLIGMLSLGIRIGFWQNEVITFESHLVGDPTFRFSSNHLNSFSSDLVFRANDESYWRGLLTDKQGIVRALAIKQLQKCYLSGKLKNNNGFSKEILDIFSSDQNMIVRMQALNALTVCADTNLTSAVLKGMYDPYEMIRRQSAHLAGKIGDSILGNELKNVVKKQNEAQRVIYAAQSALQSFSTKKPIDLKSADLLGEIRRLRNHPSHFQVDNLLNILNNPSVDTDTRVILCEALGWYNNSIHREKLIIALEVSLQNDTHPLVLKREISKTLKRLKYI